MQILAKNQTNDLITYLKSKRSKYSNLHTADRRYRTVRGVRTRRLFHLHGMHLRPRFIEGYVCGENIEFQYKLDLSGSSTIIYHPNITIVEADKYLRGMKKEIMKKVGEVDIDWPPKRTKGMFYLRRSKNPTVTQSAADAISQNILSDRFVKTLTNWDLIVIKGR